MRSGFAQGSKWGGRIGAGLGAVGGVGAGVPGAVGGSLLGYGTGTTLGGVLGGVAGGVKGLYNQLMGSAPQENPQAQQTAGPEDQTPYTPIATAKTKQGPVPILRASGTTPLVNQTLSNLQQLRQMYQGVPKIADNIARVTAFLQKML